MDLRIDYQETRKTGQEVQSKAADFGKLLGEIDALNNNLKQSWKGADAESYTAKIAEQAQVMNKLKTTMDEIGAFLIKVGDAYEQAMEENKIQ